MNGPTPAAEVAPRRRGTALALGAGLLVYLALHAAAFGRVPDGVTFDTAAEALRGIRLVVERRLEVMTFSVGPSAETLYLYLVGAVVQLLGPTRLAILLPSIGAAVAVVAMTVLVVRKLSRETPLFVPLLLSMGSLWLFHYGESGLRAISAPVFLLLAAWSVHVAETTTTPEPSPRALILSGAALGLGIYSYSACRLLPVAYALHKAAQVLLFHRERRRVLTEIRSTLVGFAAISIPNLFFALRLPGEFFNRGYYVNRGGAREHLENVLSTLLLPFGYPDRYRVQIGEGHIFDGSGVALTAAGLNPLDPLLGIAFVVGLVLSLRNSLSPGISYLCAVWLSGVLLLGFSGPSLTRLILLLPVFLVFASLAVGRLIRSLPRGAPVVFALLATWASAQAYFYATRVSRSPVTAEKYKPAINAMGERARDLLDANHRVALVCTAGGHCVKYFTHRHIDRLWLVQTLGKPLDPATLPPLDFQADVLLVENVPELEAYAASFGVPSRASRPDLFREIALPKVAARVPPLPGNVKKVWSDISR